MRTKLAALLFLPLVAVLALAGVRLVEVGDRVGNATRVADLTTLGADLSRLTRLLHDERMAALAYLAVPGAADTGFREAVKAVDAQTQVVRDRRAAIEEIPDLVTERLTAAETVLRALPETRGGVSDRSATVPDTARGYGDALAGMTGFAATVGRVAEPGPVADGLRTLAAFDRVEAAAAQQAAVTFVARTAGGLTAERQQAIVAAQAIRQQALTDLRSVATPEQVALVEAVTTDDAVARADAFTTAPDRLAATTPDELVDGFGTVTELLGAAERQLDEQVGAVARDSSTDTSRRATIEFVLVLLVLLAAVAVAVYLGRSMHLAVRRLREGALAVANRDLPDAVTRLQDVENLGDGGVDRIVAQTRDPILVTEDDEFGQVAEAFNMVHREAIRVAAEQAALRTSVSAMFLSLARRSQTLVDRMIGELDQIERTEEDPKRLARLFELDHLATRMRRNDENLLVLAGAEVGAPRREDALLIDVLRAAQSEVELYHRIEFGSIDTDVLVSAAAVNDVVRLIAELLDNATRFSPPSTPVMTHGGRAGDHVVVQVEDRGLGISADQMEQINRRLTEPTAVDVSAFRLMGFAVIGRLAARHGIGIELRPGSEGGTIAEITLPAGVAVLPGVPASVPSRSRPALVFGAGRAESRPPARSTPMPSSESSFRRPEPVEGPLDLAPTPDRPPLPARSPKPAEPAAFRAVAGSPAAAAFPAGAAFPAATASPRSVAHPAEGALPSAEASAGAFPAGAAFPSAGTSFAGAAFPSAGPRSARAVLPSAGASSAGAALPSAAGIPADDKIQLEMRENWFERIDEAPAAVGMPTAGYAPPPTPVEVAPVPVPPTPAPAAVPPAPPVAPPAAVPHVAPMVPPAAVPPVRPVTPPAAASPVVPPGDAGGTAVPKPRQPSEDRWRTTADDGWQRANAAAVPPDAGITRSGLPKRIPQAQLVPGGVQIAPRTRHRRNPDEVRGLLSSYHRGVQRGRTDGVAGSAATVPKENEQ